MAKISKGDRVFYEDDATHIADYCKNGDKKSKEYLTKKLLTEYGGTVISVGNKVAVRWDNPTDDELEAFLPYELVTAERAEEIISNLPQFQD